MCLPQRPGECRLLWKGFASVSLPQGGRTKYVRNPTATLGCYILPYSVVLGPPFIRTQEVG